MIHNVTVKHILRFGTNAEKKIIREYLKSFNTLAINANMVAYTPGSIASFIQEIKLNNSEYFIDPLTHSFQHSLRMIQTQNKKTQEYKLKSSIEKLIEYYGEPIKKAIIDDNITIKPEHFSSSNTETFVKNVIDFQLTIIPNQVIAMGFDEYLNEDDIKMLFKPELVIAPYFFVEDSDSQWIDLNIMFAKIAVELYATEKVYAQLVIPKYVLNHPHKLDHIISKYSALNTKGIMIWIDNFNEHEASIEELRAYANLVKKFSLSGLETISLYSGYFSTCLASFKEELGFNLDGVTHGVEYGEFRAVVPVGGGIPTSKYYYYPLHQRLNFTLAQDLLEEQDYFEENKVDDYFKNICYKTCAACKELFDGQKNLDNFQAFENTEFYTITLRGSTQRRTYADAETKRYCILHYLFSKHRELIELRNLSLEKHLTVCNSTYNSYIEYAGLNKSNLIYLDNWCQVLDMLAGDVMI